MPMQCRVVTPDKAYFDGEAEYVVVPAWDGEMGIYSNHAPMIARLGYGVLRVRTGGSAGAQRIAIFGGFLKVKDNTVVILAGGARSVADIDRAVAEKDLSEAKAAVEQTRQASEVERAAANEALMRAEAVFAAVNESPAPIPELAGG